MTWLLKIKAEHVRGEAFHATASYYGHCRAAPECGQEHANKASVATAPPILYTLYSLICAQIFQFVDYPCMILSC